MKTEKAIEYVKEHTHLGLYFDDKDKVITDTAALKAIEIVSATNDTIPDGYFYSGENLEIRKGGLLRISDGKAMLYAKVPDNMRLIKLNEYLNDGDMVFKNNEWLKLPPSYIGLLQDDPFTTYARPLPNPPSHMSSPQTDSISPKEGR